MNYLAKMNFNYYFFNRCNLLQEVCDLIFSEDLDQSESQHLAASLCHLFSHELHSHNSLLPQDVTQE